MPGSLKEQFWTLSGSLKAPGSLKVLGSLKVPYRADNSKMRVANEFYALKMNIIVIFLNSEIVASIKRVLNM